MSDKGKTELGRRRVRKTKTNKPSDYDTHRDDYFQNLTEGFLSRRKTPEINLIHEDGDESEDYVSDSEVLEEKPGKFNSKTSEIIQICSLIAAVLVAGLNLIMTVVAANEKNREIYYSIVGYKYTNVKWFLALFGCILSGSLSSLSVAWRFFATKKWKGFQRANAVNLSAIGILGYFIFLSLWFAVAYLPTINTTQKMMQTLKYSYKGESNWDFYSVSWNYVQLVYRSCGAETADEWNSSSWAQHEGFDIPVFCCSEITPDSLDPDHVLETIIVPPRVERMRYECSWPWKPRKPTTIPLLTTSQVETTETKNLFWESNPTTIVEQFAQDETSTTSAMSTSATSTVSDSNKRRTRYKPFKKGETDDTGLFAPLYWEDALRTIQAEYFEPQNKQLMTWYEAQEYCQYYYSYLNPESDVIKHPPGIAVGFNTEELMFISKLEWLEQVPDPFLGFARFPGQSPKEFTVPGYADIKLTKDTFYDQWAPENPNPKPRSPEPYGHLHEKYGMRGDMLATRAGKFICAKYEKRIKGEEKLNSIHRIYYEKPLTDTILGKYFIVDKLLRFEDAAEYCSTTFGVHWVLAIGINAKEMYFLADISRTAGINTNTIHLGFTQVGNSLYYVSSKFTVEGTDLHDRRVMFGTMWHKGDPGSGKFGMFSRKNLARISSLSDTKSSFVCAKYKTIPQKPFDDHTGENQTLDWYFPDGRRVFRPNLINDGVKVIEPSDKGAELTSLVFDWESAIHSLKARYFVPVEGHKLVWEEAMDHCNQIIRKLEPERDFSQHKPTIAIGFTTDEIEMLHKIDDFVTKKREEFDSIHLGIVRGPSNGFTAKVYPSVEFKQDGTIGGMRYDLWEEGQPQMLEKELIGGMNVEGYRFDAITDAKKPFLCANYTYSASGFSKSEQHECIPNLKYHLYVTDKIYGEYWVVEKPYTYDYANFYCPFIFGPGFKVAIGLNQKEMKFVADVFKIVKLKASGMHLGFERKKDEEFFRSTVFGEKFRKMWNSGEPSDKGSYGCLRKGKEHGLAACEQAASTFTCVIYEKTPFDAMLGYFDRNTHNLSDGARKEVTQTEESLELAAEIFDWESQIHYLKGRYFIPKEASRLNWEDAAQKCTEIIHKLEPNRSFEIHKPGLPVGFTTDELEMLSKIDYLSDQDSPYLRFQRFYTEKNLLFNTDHYDWDFDSRGRMLQNMFTYEDWDVGMTVVSKTRLNGCMNLAHRKRTSCSDVTNAFICANYTFSQLGFDNNQQLSYIPGIMYQYFVNEHIYAEYWIVRSTKQFSEAVDYCGYTYGPGFTLAIGVNQKELNFVASLALNSGLTGDMHLGFKREPLDGYFTSLDLGIKFSPFWNQHQKQPYSKAYYGCLDTRNGLIARAMCPNFERKFVCAVYEKVPFDVTDKTIARHTGGAMLDEKRNNETTRVARVFQWQSPIKDVKATYYVPQTTSQNVSSWKELSRQCAELIHDSSNNLTDSSTQKPTVAIGFTSDEIHMLANLDLTIGDPLAHSFVLGIHESQNKQFVSDMHPVTLERDGNLNGKRYEGWSYGEPTMRAIKSEGYGCLVKGERHNCVRRRLAFICANYTYSEEGFTKSSLPLKNISRTMYTLFVSEILYAEYWTVFEPRYFEEAQGYCPYVFGPGFTIAVGFNSKELDYLQFIWEDARFGNVDLHLGLQWTHEEGFFTSLVFGKRFGPLWHAGEPNGTPRQENPVCLNRVSGSWARADCDIRGKPVVFVCALYEKTPLDSQEAAIEDERDVKTYEVEPHRKKENKAKPHPFKKAKGEKPPSPVNDQGSVAHVREKLKSFPTPITILLTINFVLLIFILVSSVIICWDKL